LEAVHAELQIINFESNGVSGALSWTVSVCKKAVLLSSHVLKASTYDLIFSVVYSFVKLETHEP
jgi:hypothetical protein